MFQVKITRTNCNGIQSLNLFQVTSSQFMKLYFIDFNGTSWGFRQELVTCINECVGFIQDCVAVAHDLVGFKMDDHSPE